MKFIKILFLSMIILLTGCYSARFNILPRQNRPEFEGRILVFYKNLPHDIDFIDMGDFRMQKRWYGNTRQTRERAMKMAASKGANGLLIENQGLRVTGWSWASPYTEGKLLWIKNYDYANSLLSGKINKNSVEYRLNRLKKLYNDKIITKEEYDIQRKKVLQDL